nr:hypothetical protein [Faecalibaculum rodentium]
MKAHTVKAYNLIFPVYMIMLLSPVLWVFMIIGNFLVDSLVLLATIAILGSINSLRIWKSSIFRIVCFGFLSDLAGSLLNAILAFIVLSDFYVGITPYSWPGCALLALPAILTAAILIYILNSRFSFRKTSLDTSERRKTALALAIITAPWVMMIPLDAWSSFFALFRLG